MGERAWTLPQDLRRELLAILGAGAAATVARIEHWTVHYGLHRPRAARRAARDAFAARRKADVGLLSRIRRQASQLAADIRRLDPGLRALLHAELMLEGKSQRERRARALDELADELEAEALCNPEHIAALLANLAARAQAIERAPVYSRRGRKADADWIHFCISVAGTLAQHGYSITTAEPGEQRSRGGAVLWRVLNAMSQELRGLDADRRHVALAVFLARPAEPRS